MGLYNISYSAQFPVFCPPKTPPSNRKNDDHMNQNPSSTSLANINEKARTEAQRLIASQTRWSHPFRSRWEHTLRVLRWAERIQACEGGDWGVIWLAVLFHDCGWSETLDHALVGAELVEAFLRAEGVEPALVERVAWAVRTHNKRRDPAPDLPLENRIVMDADLLDELGITTLVWDAMATALEEQPGYRQALERDLAFFNHAKCKLEQLQTPTGVRLYQERLAFWEKCLSHLRYELGLADEFMG